MITNKLKQCCYQCDHSDVNVDVDSYGGVYVRGEELLEGRVHCTIYCSHAKVCKAYIESEE